MTLVHLQLGFVEQDLAYTLNVSPSRAHGSTSVLKIKRNSIMAPMDQLSVLTSHMPGMLFPHSLYSRKLPWGDNNND